MNGFGDNPFDDGLDFVGCPPQTAEIVLPEFKSKFRNECKLICWGRCKPFPDGQRKMKVNVEAFREVGCGIYSGVVYFTDIATGDVWYKGRLTFYYTRNYLRTALTTDERRQKKVAFRFVVKGDIKRVADDMPEWECLILCSKLDEAERHGVRAYSDIFVYGGLEIFWDVEKQKQQGFRLSLGHNDGWYTHLKKCSARPITELGHGDYIGHYCDRGWLFVSPGRNFVFNNGIEPPTGRFTEEALRQVGERCLTEEAITFGYFVTENRSCIHWYQRLRGWTECNSRFDSADSCQGMVDTRDDHSWITFFSMGYWQDRLRQTREALHLVEGNINLVMEEQGSEQPEFYYYGFSTKSIDEQRKLVDLASNKDVIGMPADTSHLLYLYNAGPMALDPKVREPARIDRRLVNKLLRSEMDFMKKREPCPFLEEREEE